MKPTTEFTYVSKYAPYIRCVFNTGTYQNGNLALQISSTEEGPITTVTVNPGVVISHDQIAIKNWSENEGMDEFLKTLELIEDTPVRFIPSGYVKIPVYNLTESGKELFA